MSRTVEDLRVFIHIGGQRTNNTIGIDVDAREIDIFKRRVVYVAEKALLVDNAPLVVAINGKSADSVIIAVERAIEGILLLADRCPITRQRDIVSQLEIHARAVIAVVDVSSKLTQIFLRLEEEGIIFGTFAFEIAEEVRDTFGVIDEKFVAVNRNGNVARDVDVIIFVAEV